MQRFVYSYCLLGHFDVSVANENVSLVISRQILTEFCSYFPSLPDAVGKEVAHYTLDKVQPRVVSFEEQVGQQNPVILL